MQLYTNINSLRAPHNHLEITEPHIQKETHKTTVSRSFEQLRRLVTVSQPVQMQLYKGINTLHASHNHPETTEPHIQKINPQDNR